MTKSIPKYGNTLTVIRLYGKRIINQILKTLHKFLLERVLFARLDKIYVH